MGDRFYWAWGLIDFGNASFQGAAHGMARLWRNGMWPYQTPQKLFLERINSMYMATARLTRRDGSLEEAFPNEGSYCVTALVAFDLLCTMEILRPEIDKQTQQRWQRIIQPLIGYLITADETHATISNHLATAVASLVRWHRLMEETTAENKALILLDRILDRQSREGWFCEYGGADPGYQSLCTCYLADVHQQRPDFGLLAPLQRSLEFLCHFAHPDGSFGGLYGSRNTRFYYPCGVLALASESPHAASLANFMEQSIAKQRVVTCSSMDEPNLVPMFNAYCWAAQLSLFRHENPKMASLPSQGQMSFRRHFSEAGIWVDKGVDHYTLINTHKGGVVTHFFRGVAVTIEAGVVIRNPSGQLGSTQAFNPNNSVHIKDSVLNIEAHVVPISKRLPNPGQFIVLRVLGLTLFRFRVFREWVKLALVRLLVTPRKKWSIVNKRTISFGPQIEITDEINLPPGFSRVEKPGSFVSIHMASQGYWQVQDEEHGL
ncbi:MAG: hypothetical protein EOL98_08760 [Negativicutes bacterium]|nr:hypothetical protein [Negativicutes bacterium]